MEKNLRHSCAYNAAVTIAKQYLELAERLTREAERANENARREADPAKADKLTDDASKTLAIAQVYEKHGKQSLSEPRLRAVVKLAAHLADMQIDYLQFDQDPMLLNCLNGTINLETGQLQPHNREDYLLKQAPIEYDENAKAPRYIQFLNEIFAEKQLPDGRWEADESFLAYIQRVSGYLLTGSVKEHVMFMLHGEGRNGKSLLTNLWEAAMGDYAQTVRIETFIEMKGDRVPNDIARLCGLRFVSSSESERRHRLAQALLKYVTGGTKIDARFLHREFFQYLPAFKLVIACNHKPIIDGSDYATVERLHLVPFQIRFEDPAKVKDTEHPRDKDLEAKLRNELPGILTWMVEGAKIWARDGLGTHKKVMAATDSYAGEMDSLKAFLDDACNVNPDSPIRLRAKELGDAYTLYCREQRLTAITIKEMKKRFEDLGFTHGRDGRGAYYLGITLIQTFEQGAPIDIDQEPEPEPPPAPTSHVNGTAKTSPPPQQQQPPLAPRWQKPEPKIYDDENLTPKDWRPPF